MPNCNLEAKVFELTVEQQFRLTAIKSDYQDLPTVEVKTRLLEVMEEIMLADNAIKQQLKGALV